MYQHKVGVSNRVWVDAVYDTNQAVPPTTWIFPFAETLFRFQNVPIQGPSGLPVEIPVDTVYQILGHQPNEAAWFSRAGRNAYNAYFNFAFVTKAFFTDWRFLGPPNIPGENPVAHASIRGSTSESFVTAKPYSGEEGLVGDVRLPKLLHVREGEPDVFLSTNEDYQFDYPVFTPAHNFPKAVDEFFIGGPHTYTGITGKSYVSCTPCAFRWFFNGSVYVLQVAVYRVYPEGGGFRHTLRLRNYTYFTQVLSSVDDYDSPVDIDLLVNCLRAHSFLWREEIHSTASWKLWTSSDQAVFNSLPVDFSEPYPLTAIEGWNTPYEYPLSYGYKQHFSIPLGDRVVFQHIGYDAIEGKLLNSPSDTSFAAFTRMAHDLVEDAYGASYLASTDALSKFTVDMGINQYESMQDLYGLMLPVDVLQLLKTIAHFNRKPGHLLVKMLDILSDAELIRSFGICPTIRDYKSVASKARRFYNRWLGSFDRYVTIYGDDTVDVPEEITGSFTDVKLQVRCKAEIKLDSDMLLTALPLRSVGLLPTLSSLWDTIPGSFIADWVFPSGEAARLAEDTVIMTAITTKYATVSVLLYRDHTPAELRDLGITSTSVHDSPTLQYRAYDRVILHGLPIVGPSRIVASHFEPGIPNWGTASSLAYRFVRRS